MFTIAPSIFPSHVNFNPLCPHAHEARPVTIAIIVRFSGEFPLCLILGTDVEVLLVI